MNRTTYLALALTAGAFVAATPRQATADTGVYVSVTVTQAKTAKGQAVPVPGAWVTLVAPNGQTFRARTAGNGKCLFNNLPRNTRPIDYGVTVQYAGQTQTGKSHHLTFEFLTGP